MASSNIKVFLRVRPSGRAAPGFLVNTETGTVEVEVDKNGNDYDVNNVKTTHKFRFEGVLGMQVSQEDVLNQIAKPVIEDVLNGVNGTIFAYGQTGSGKTFTITGGPGSFADRGLIPRTISYMFEAFRKSDKTHKMYISYLEIYQNSGYDLLRDDSAQKLEDLPKVQISADADGQFHLKGLSVNTAASQEDALNLLFLGDTNRQVAETPMNDASTRSHCLFIIWIDSMAPGSDTVRRSKLHLVDLAGSERPSQTGVEGKLLQEATAINMSLFYLERVIVALHERSQGKGSHVPYRDSMMTSVLRDSLGGNCKTTMIGCVAAEATNLMESISTCRFAQRVAMIQNNARVNEELDPNLLIARLKREVGDLKKEVQIAKGGDEGLPKELTPEDVEECRALVLKYVDSKDPKEHFVCGSVDRLRAAFRILRDMSIGGGAGEGGGDGGNDAAQEAALDAECKKLRLDIAQRDQEIQIMVGLLSKQRGGAEGRAFIAAEPSAASLAGGASSILARAGAAAVAGGAALGAAAPSPSAHSPARHRDEVPAARPPPAQGPAAAATPAAATPMAAQAKPAARPRIPGERRTPAPLMPTSDAVELLLDKQRAFEVFKQTVWRPEAFEENKAMLAEKMAVAKQIGNAALEVRNEMNVHKNRLEKLRTERAMTAAGGDDGPLEDGPEALAEVREIDRLKVAYRERTNELKGVKGDVEMIQRLLEQNKVKMQKDFEAWFVALRKQASLNALDEETKRELYEKVTGVSEGSASGTPSAAAGAPALPGHGAREAPASFSASPRPPVSARKTGDTRTDDDIAAYYAALGELAKQG